MKRNKKSDEEIKCDAKNTTIKTNDLKENFAKTDGQKRVTPRSKLTKYVEKQVEEEDGNVKSASSKILKPVVCTFKEKSGIQNKTSSRENSQNNVKEGKVTSARDRKKKDGFLSAEENAPSKDLEILTGSEAKRPNESSKITGDDGDRSTVEEGNEMKAAKDDNDAGLSSGSSKNVKNRKECKLLFKRFLQNACINRAGFGFSILQLSSINKRLSLLDLYMEQIRTDRAIQYK